MLNSGTFYWPNLGQSWELNVEAPHHQLDFSQWLSVGSLEEFNEATLYHIKKSQPTYSEIAPRNFWGQRNGHNLFTFPRFTWSGVLFGGIIITKSMGLSHVNTPEIMFEKVSFSLVKTVFQHTHSFHPHKHFYNQRYALRLICQFQQIKYLPHLIITQEELGPPFLPNPYNHEPSFVYTK